MKDINQTINRMKASQSITLTNTHSEWSEEEYIKKKCEMENLIPGKLNEDDGYECEKCMNRGNIYFAKFDLGHWYETARICECQKVRHSILMMKKSGLSGVIKKCTFDKYETTEEWQKILKHKAMEYAKNHGTAWFFVGGQSGCGKSHLCTAICRHFLKSGTDVKYMAWRDDITRLKANVTESNVYNRMIGEYKNATVLYIDDLFKTGKDNLGKEQRPTAADINAAFEIINYRYNNPNLLTIISTERSSMELAEIDEAVAGRICEKAFDAGFGLNIKKDPKKNYRMRNSIEL